MEQEELLKKQIANNIAYYRKENGLTQMKLAEILNYSDKAVSKWERGESAPDIYTLTLLCNIFHCSIDDLIYEKKKKKKQVFFKNRLVISLLSIMLAWLVGVVLYTILVLIEKNVDKTWDWLWILFIYPIPISFIIALVFGKIWGKRWMRFIFVTGIVWGVGLTIFCHFLIGKIAYGWTIWLVCAVFQVIVILWYLLKRKKKEVN
jgi:transcriptional regulator with XRE-family HTH domain